MKILQKSIALPEFECNVVFEAFTQHQELKGSTSLSLSFPCLALSGHSCAINFPIHSYESLCNGIHKNFELVFAENACDDAISWACVWAIIWCCMYSAVAIFSMVFSLCLFLFTFSLRFFIMLKFVDDFSSFYLPFFWRVLCRQFEVLVNCACVCAALMQPGCILRSVQDTFWLAIIGKCIEAERYLCTATAIAKESHKHIHTHT